MLEIFLYAVSIAIIVLLFSAAFFALQLVWDRFWTVSFPILMEVYGRWRYPDKFKD